MLKVIFFISTLLSFPLMADFNHTYPDFGKLLTKYIHKKGNQTFFNYQELNKKPKELERVLLNFRALKKVILRNSVIKKSWLFL
ncbi:MAG: hypothetical protein NXH75_00720 [Halobacteriovoraceae bacterium]|nr:hypothetical protein [Halobacteriovoraceae bacterium]